MTNDIILPRTNKNAVTKVDQGGSGNTNIASVTGGLHMTVVQRTQLASYPSPANVNYEFYNLVVVDLFRDMKSIIPSNLALTQNINKTIKDVHSSLSEEAIASIKTYPSLIISTSDSELAYIGYVKDVVNTSAGIGIQFNPKFEVKYRLIKSLLKELDLTSTPEISELDRIHWTIKQVNLLDTLENAGVEFPRM